MLLARPSGATRTIALVAKLQGVFADGEEPAPQPCCVEERSYDRETDHWQDRPEERPRDPGDEIHVPDDAQGW